MRNIVLCIIVFCGYTQVIAQVSSRLSQKEATNIVINKIINGETKDKEIFVSDTIISSKGKIRDIFFIEKSPPFDSWFFFIDDNPLANWEHPCRYVFVNVKDGSFEIYNETRPPKRDGMSCIINYKAKVTDKRKQLFNFTRKDSLTKAAGKSAFSQSRNYAVIISGGGDKYSNYERYWNDCSAIYSALTRCYCYKRENIYTLLADGINPDLDRRRIDGSFDSSPLDLDGDGINDINYSATKNNISHVFDELAEKLTQSDTLFIFTTDHGGRNYGNSVYLLLWNNDLLTDTDFAYEVNKVNAGKIIICMGQCNSGGFIDNLQSYNRVITTACRYDELSYAMDNLLYDEYIYHWISAVIGENLSGNVVNADTNFDGKISIYEAFVYAENHDMKPEHPQYNSTPANFGLNLSLSNLFISKGIRITGSTNICSNSEIFQIQNFPTGCTVNWSVSNSCVQIISGQGTDSVTLQRNDDGWATLTATISYNGTVVKTLSKEIMVGTPAFCMNVIPVAADGSQGYWRSDLNGNTIDVEFVNSNARYPNYVVDLYRIDNGFSVGTHLGHWVTPSLSDMTFGYYPQGWYYIEVVGMNDCGTSEAWGTELECVDGNDLQNRMFSFIYEQSSAMLTVTLNPNFERAHKLSRKQILSGSASAGSYEVQLWSENTLLRSYKATDAQLQIPMSGMKAGLYVVRAVKDGKTQQRKLIKK